VPVAPWVIACFGINWMYMMASTMWNAISEAYVCNEGKSIKAVLKRGGDVIIPIEKIKKL